jgi:DNA primase
MSDVKHTPGPWHILFGGLEGDDSFTIASKVSPGAVADYAVAAPRPWREVQANARLIAAAPDLLHALECIMGTTAHLAAWQREYPKINELCRVALAKAEGRL